MVSLEAQLLRHEKMHLKPYQDADGKWIVGVNRNLSDTGITEEEALFLLRNDIARVRVECEAAFPWFDALSPIRKCVVLDLAFSLGITRLQGMKMTLRLISERRYTDAAAHIRKSKWAIHQPLRTLHLTSMLEHDIEPDW